MVWSNKCITQENTVEIYYIVRMRCTLTVWSEETKKGGQRLTSLVAWVVSVSAVLKPLLWCVVVTVALVAVASKGSPITYHHSIG